MNQETKEYLDKKFRDADEQHTQAQNELLQNLRNRKKTLLRIVSVYVVVMSVVLTILIIYFLGGFNKI